MMKNSFILTLVTLILLSFNNSYAVSDGIRIKELSRLSGARDNSLVGYGVVTGLSGTGDSSRSYASLKSLSNVLKRFGVQVTAKQLRSRNAAVVILTSTLRPYLRPGDKIDVNVTSLGDARSLVGGTLILTHLLGPDNNIYALAQGSLLVGGYTYDVNGNVVQKNHTTSATIPSGATVERAVTTDLLTEAGKVEYVLHEPDFTTANRVAVSLNKKFKKNLAIAIDASRIEITVPENMKNNLVRFLMNIENVSVRPDVRAKLVINERTGTIVSGGNITISKINITHGDLKIDIKTENIVSQPIFVKNTSDGVKTEIVSRNSIGIKEPGALSVSLPNGTSVNDLLSALNKLNATSRDIITILQAVKRAGALHAELIIQ